MSVFCFLPANMGVPVLTSMEDTPVCVKMDGLAQTVKWVGSLEIISYCNVCFNSWVMWCHFMKNKEKEFFYYPIIYPYNFDFMISNIITKCTVYKMKFFSFRHWWVPEKPLLQQWKLYQLVRLILLQMSSGMDGTLLSGWWVLLLIKYILSFILTYFNIF